ncbi:ATP-dependent RNA helicase DbpA [Oceanobacter mangrovi]|uniref:ATP-dependent RNA helicase DbpA n=1 Tax=Oceanobacter mangrovi TaxID=2862510 RepID=UPI001C8E35B8|nr:ATP-dependent RNA helicase DbpA [Oceanobacter mangrovi]
MTNPWGSGKNNAGKNSASKGKNSHPKPADRRGGSNRPAARKPSDNSRFADEQPVRASRPSAKPARRPAARPAPDQQPAEYPKYNAQPVVDPSDNQFSTLALPAAQIDNLSQLGYTRLTRIQELALPLALAGKDLLGQAKTGSGKTASFGIPLLNKLNNRFFGVQGLVLCPTRELATQVANELRKLAKYQPNIKMVVLSGGVAIGPQIGSLEHGAHVVIGTPGRIRDHLRKGTLVLDQVETLVLDEADRMLDMGFADDIDFIIGHTPEQRQTLLFSATYPDNIQQLSKRYQQQPEFIRVESVHTGNSIDQRFVMCDKSNRLQALQRILAQFDFQQAVLFCNTRQATEEVADYLGQFGFDARALHGDMEQKERDQVLSVFKQGSIHFLVATDVAARGLDVDDLPAVINIELPRDNEVYTHRIGRTGRAGKEGIALSLLTDKEDYKRLAIEEQQQREIPRMALEELSSATPEAVETDWVTICISAGRKQKIRPGDVLGALTGEHGIAGSEVGKIDVLDMVSYVAVKRSAYRAAMAHIKDGRIKGKPIRARRA